MNNLKTPLFDALYAHSKQNPQSFHVPGHKNGTVFPYKGQDYYRDLLKIDATELTGLDDLHQPEGAIMEAEELTARLYGVKKTFFLVNGSTVGNLAMILATCKRNDTVLIQRNCHKSIINGLKLAGTIPVFLQPEFDETLQVPTYVSFATVKHAVQEYPNVKAVILTSPNYYGMSNPSELSQIISLMHINQIPVLIDEAHGAHFIVEGFPTSAIALGADIVVHSAHKTLPAMTMGSYLHMNSQLISMNDVQYYLQILQSSSPSYPIMASLDLARLYLEQIKTEGIHEIETSINEFKNDLQIIKQIKVVESKNNDVQTDLLKLTIQSQCELNGYELQSALEKYGIFTELADPNNVLFVLPLSNLDNRKYIKEQIKKALSKYSIIERKYRRLEITTEPITVLPTCYHEIKRYNKKVVSFEQAIGNISGEMIIPYPPGIPILMEGERITRHHIDIISTYLGDGARFQGGDMKNFQLTVLVR